MAFLTNCEDNNSYQSLLSSDSVLSNDNLITLLLTTVNVFATYNYL